MVLPFGGVGPGSGTVGLGHIMSLVSPVQKSRMFLKRYHWRWAERQGDLTRGGGGGGGAWGTAPASPTKTGSICVGPSFWEINLEIPKNI